MTSKGYGGNETKWTKTDMAGKLHLVLVKEFQGFPCVVIQLGGTDAAGIERAVVFEYELPFNFIFERDISNNLCGIKLGNGHYVGFQFGKPAN